MTLLPLLAPTRALPSLGKGPGHGMRQRASMQALGKAATMTWTRQQHHRPRAACPAWPRKDKWDPLVTVAIQDLRSQDPAVQAGAAERLARFGNTEPAAMQQLVPSGAVKALSDAVLSDSWKVKSMAVTALAMLGIRHIDVGAAIPAQEIAHALVDMLRQLPTMTDEEWKDLGETHPSRERVHLFLVALLGAQAEHNAAAEHGQPLPVPVDVVSCLSGLLEEDYKVNPMCTAAAHTLAVLAATVPSLLDPVSKSVAIDRIGSWLSTDEAGLVKSAAQALGRMAYNERLRAVLDEKGIFGKLMTLMVKSKQNQNATFMALSQWGEERIEAELSNYS